MANRRESTCMSDAEYAVLGIGNAIVDLLSNVEDSWVAKEGFEKGSMTLIDAARAVHLSEQLSASKLTSGGSAANTIAGLASFGSRVAYMGKVGTDGLGTVFGEDMKNLGVAFRTLPSDRGTPTARCVVLVTPDAQRTMCTYLGACVELSPSDIDLELVGMSRITYLEGYLWDPPEAKLAFQTAARAAHEAGRIVSLSLSDSFCVGRHRESFLELVKNHVDILFANESELISLVQEKDVRSSLMASKDLCRTVAVTCGKDGCLVSAEGSIIEVPAAPVSRVVDTTGAGDLFAAGFLHGVVTRRTPRDSALLGGLAAAEIISHFGARPERELAALA
jgi:sugar/nucleoside kinase (ribokinase family)